MISRQARPPIDRRRLADDAFRDAQIEDAFVNSKCEKRMRFTSAAFKLYSINCFDFATRHHRQSTSYRKNLNACASIKAIEKRKKQK